MTITTWEPGTFYLQGQVVVPRSLPGITLTEIPNADFEGGDTEWTKGTGWAINQTEPFNGDWSAEYTGTGVEKIVSATKHPIQPGKSITARCFVMQGLSDPNEANAAIILEWYDDMDALISTSTGNAVTEGDGTWHESTLSAIAPPGAAKVAVGATALNDPSWSAPLYVDAFSWNYVTSSSPNILAYKNVGDAGTSGTSEPIWPTTVGGQVADPPLTGDPEPDPPPDPPEDPPAQASSPNPSNGATGVDVEANLFWTAGADASSHNVYFGTVNPPGAGQSQGNQSGTSFDPGTMVFSTTYYWRIDEVNVEGTTEGDVWSFTTEADPGPPPDPEPPSETDLVNPGFESGDTGWTKSSGWTIKDHFEPRSGDWCTRWYSTNTEGGIRQSNRRAVSPGTSITGSCWIKNDDPSHTNGRAILTWYDADNMWLAETEGSIISSTSYARSTVGGTAPGGAAFVSLGCLGTSLQGDFGHFMFVDDFEWNY